MITPEDVPEVFEVDGSWRDIYVLGTTTADWDVLLSGLRAQYSNRVRYIPHETPSELPAHSEGIFRVRADFSPLLSIDLDGLILNSHFFWSEEIEFDMDPRGLTPANFAELLEFLRWIGKRLRKVVLLTPENRQNIPLLAYLPDIDQVVSVRKMDRDLPR